MKKFIKKVVRFIGKVFAYLPVLWRDEDYDYGHILSLLKYKLKRTRQHILKHDIIADAQEVADQISYAENLIQRLQDDDYLPELEKAHTEKWGDWVLEDNDAYPLGRCRENVFTPELDKQQRQEQQEIWRLIEETREKDWNELWEHLNKNMRSFWD